MSPLAPSTRAWIEAETGSAVAASAELDGATTATVSLLDFEDGRRLVAKVFDRQDFLDERPDRARHEAALLDLLGPTAVPVPELIAVDAVGDASGTPTVLMSWVEGDAEPPAQWISAIASNLIDLHGVDPGPITWEYERYNLDREVFVPSWAADPAVWEDAFAIASDPPVTAEGLIHRDYHPGNLLWHDGELAGVLDWLSGCLGPLAIDLAHLRSNLLMDEDPEAADAVLEAYRRAGSGDAWHPAWDVVDAVDFLPYWDEPGRVEEWSWDHRPIAETRARFDDRLANAVRLAT
jgi:aminoglycoside phosphotransferase (APT) family kinase protein